MQKKQQLFQLQVPKSLISSDKISNYDISCYLMIQTLKSSLYDNIHFNARDLVSNIFNIDASAEDARKISKAITILSDCGYLKLNRSGNSYSILKVFLNVTAEPFAYIKYEDFIKLIRSNKKNKHMLIRYYCAVVGAINNDAEVSGKKGVTAKMPVAYLAKIMNCSVSTILTLNKDLEEMQLIYIGRSAAMTIADDGTKYREMNVYGLYENKEYIDRANSSTDVVNKRRKLAAMFNQMKKGKHYSSEEEREVMEYIRNRNTNGESVS